LYRCVVDDIAGKATGISFVNTFLGSEDARWSNPLNWSCKSLPTERTHVLVAAPIIVDINATIKKITVLPGISLSMGPGVSLSIKP
jgi:hypothetical protein